MQPVIHSFNAAIDNVMAQENFSQDTFNLQPEKDVAD